MKRWVLVSIAIAAFLILLLSVLVYYFAGLKEYLGAIKHLNSLQSDEKTDTYNSFFGKGRFDNFYGGILAQTWKNGILIWEKSGLKYFRAEKSAQFIIVTGCTQSSLYNSRTYNIKSMPHLNAWRLQARPGNYTAFQTTKNGLLSLVALYPDFRTTDIPWIFCHIALDTNKIQ